MTTQTSETSEEQAPSTENFAEMLDEFVGDSAKFEGRLIKGTVLSIDNDAALIDVGLKGATEGIRSSRPAGRA